MRENIWVGVRLRPVPGADSCWTCTQPGLLQQRDAQGLYHYDRVLEPSSTTADVLEAIGEDRFLCALQGFSSTLFCYGPTGSGKTHTIETLLPLVSRMLFQAARDQRDRDITMHVTALEIYNERIRDLLQEGTENQDLDVIDQTKRATVVRGLTDIAVQSAAELDRVAAVASARRTVRDTRSNAASSRSHLILRIHIDSRPAASRLTEGPAGASGDCPTEDGRPALLGTLSLVDLAGSERISNASLDDVQQRVRVMEGGTINKSLLTLGTVIRGLSEQSAAGVKGAPARIAYRDSKLTRVLKGSLEGSGRTAIIACINPSARHVESARSALHFADTARRVSLAPEVNLVLPPLLQIRQLRADNTALQARLDSARQEWNATHLATVEDLRARLLAAEKAKQSLEERLAELQQEHKDAHSNSELIPAQHAPIADVPATAAAAQLQAELDQQWAHLPQARAPSRQMTRQRSRLAPAEASPFSQAADGGTLQRLRSELSSASSTELHRAASMGEDASGAGLASANTSDVPSVLAQTPAGRADFERKLLFDKVLGLEDQLQRHRSRAALLQEQVKEQQPPMRAPAASDDLPGPTAPPLLSVSPDEARARVPRLNLTEQGLQDEDSSWSTPLDRQGIIKQVAHLWHAHSVPLKLRARFWTGFHAREDYFFAAELRRLRHLDQRLREATAAESPVPERSAAAATLRRHARAARQLQWERRWLEAQLNQEMGPGQREALFEEWGIPASGKQRKRRLIAALFEPHTLQQADGLECSARLVLILHGLTEDEDADTLAEELIFSRTNSSSWWGLSAVVPAALQGRLSRAVAASTPRVLTKGRTSSLLSSLRLTPRSMSATSQASQQG